MGKKSKKTEQSIGEARSKYLPKYDRSNPYAFYSSSKNKKDLDTYDDLLEEFDYRDIESVRRVLKNFYHLQKLSERGVSNAAVIMADIFKALSADVNGHKKVTWKQWEAIYYYHICNLPLDECREIMKCSERAVYYRLHNALIKIVDILGEAENEEN